MGKVAKVVERKKKVKKVARKRVRRRVRKKARRKARRKADLIGVFSKSDIIRK